MALLARPVTAAVICLVKLVMGPLCGTIIITKIVKHVPKGFTAKTGRRCIVRRGQNLTLARRVAILALQDTAYRVMSTVYLARRIMSVHLYLARKRLALVVKFLNTAQTCVRLLPQPPPVRPVTSQIRVLKGNAPLVHLALIPLMELVV